MERVSNAYQIMDSRGQSKLVVVAEFIGQIKLNQTHVTAEICISAFSSFLACDVTQANLNGISGNQQKRISRSSRKKGVCPEH